METEEMHASTDELLLEKAEQTEEAVLAIWVICV